MRFDMGSFNEFSGPIFDPQTLDHLFKNHSSDDSQNSSSKQARIAIALQLLKDHLKKKQDPMYKPEKVYGDALYKALLRQLRRWVIKNLLDPVLLNVKPNPINMP